MPQRCRTLWKFGEQRLDDGDNTSSERNEYVRVEILSV